MAEALKLVLTFPFFSNFQGKKEEKTPNITCIPVTHFLYVAIKACSFYIQIKLSNFTYALHELNM